MLKAKNKRVIPESSFPHPETKSTQNPVDPSSKYVRNPTASHHPYSTTPARGTFCRLCYSNGLLTPLPASAFAMSPLPADTLQPHSTEEPLKSKCLSCSERYQPPSRSKHSPHLRLLQSPADPGLSGPSSSLLMMLLLGQRVPPTLASFLSLNLPTSFPTQSTCSRCSLCLSCSSLTSFRLLHLLTGNNYGLVCLLSLSPPRIEAPWGGQRMIVLFSPLSSAPNSAWHIVGMQHICVEWLSEWISTHQVCLLGLWGCVCENVICTCIYMYTIRIYMSVSISTSMSIFTCKTQSRTHSFIKGCTLGFYFWLCIWRGSFMAKQCCAWRNTSPRSHSYQVHQRPIF